MGLNELQEALGGGVPRFRARQVYDALYRQKISSFPEISSLPVSLRQDLSERFLVGLPEVEARHGSSDGTRRYLLRTNDLRTVEAVFMPEEARDTICISSQVGCPVDCKFCLTALMGLERNLTAGEIVGQVLVVMRDNGLRPEARPVNIVMMGMGEPFLNLPHVLQACRLLIDPDGINIPPRRVTVSTSGIIPAIQQFAHEPNRPKLAISLNASTEEQRQKLMPITRKYHLADLLDVCRAYPLRPWERLTFEYVLLRNVNDTDADARRVARMLSNIKCKLNVIALNPGPGIPFATPDPARVDAFQAIVRKSVPCFVRRPRGRDIYAACGQLKRTSESELIPLLASSSTL